MSHQCLPEDEAGHLRVRLIVQQPVEAVVQGLLLAAILSTTVEMERKSGDGLGKDTDTYIDRSHLHGGPLVHTLA